jgi:16S rRNA (uracil1498-N3)-methyltransferase
MPANRFFYEGVLPGKGSTIQLTESEHHHMQVMRVSPGEEVEIVNGLGALALAQVLDVKKKGTDLVLMEVQQTAQPVQQLVLIIPFMRAGKLEWIIEKGTEIGADAFYIYAATYSEKGQLSSNQLERLHNLCCSALKQSGRLFLPSIEVFPSLERALLGEFAYYFGDTRGAGITLLDVPYENRIALITGPERGFSPAELELLQKKARGVSLSANILRAETAPIVGLSMYPFRFNGT